MKDRFSEYIASKMGIQKAEQYIFGSSNMNTPHRKYYPNYQSSQSSIDSSALSLSETITQSMSERKSSYGKTVSVHKKRLKKVLDIEDNVCSICLDTYRDRVQLSCRHYYCHQCLLEWLKTSSRCPYCREDCSFYLKDNVKHEIQSKEFDYEENGGDIQFDYECYLCGQTEEGDTVIVCDGCEVHACHPGCDPRLHGRMPSESEQWFCHICSQNN